MPTWNRSDLLADLLKTLKAERAGHAGKTEVVIVDSSEGDEQQKIQEHCARYDARYVFGPNSVRKKRNLGVQSSSLELILFLDSDVTVEPGFLDAHVKAVQREKDVAAAQGLTEFVGPNTFLWNATRLSKLVWSFSNPKRFPYQSWSITANLSVRRSVFEEIGGFVEDLPFKLGGDDLEMSYRINKAGYRIASAPDAVALHAKTTWNSMAALKDRTKRWGTIESNVSTMHPELYQRVIPPNYVYVALFTLVVVLAAVVARSVPLALLAVMIVPFFCVQRWIWEMRSQEQFINPVHLLAACVINGRYEFYRVRGHMKMRRPFPHAHAFVFGPLQVRGSFYADAPRLWLLVLDFLLISAAAAVIVHG